MDILKRSQKFETIIHLIWHFLSKRQIKWKIVSKFVAFLQLLNFILFAFRKNFAAFTFNSLDTYIKNFQGFTESVKIMNFYRHTPFFTTFLILWFAFVYLFLTTGDSCQIVVFCCKIRFLFRITSETQKVTVWPREKVIYREKSLWNSEECTVGNRVPYGGAQEI